MIATTIPTAKLRLLTELLGAPKEWFQVTQEIDEVNLTTPISLIQLESLGLVTTGHSVYLFASCLADRVYSWQ